jgi:hypothetical protein
LALSWHSYSQLYIYQTQRCEGGQHAITEDGQGEGGVNRNLGARDWVCCCRCRRSNDIDTNISRRRDSKRKLLSCVIESQPAGLRNWERVFCDRMCVSVRVVASTRLRNLKGQSRMSWFIQNVRLVSSLLVDAQC